MSQQAAVHSGFAPAHVRAPASTAATHMFAQPQAGLHLGFEVCALFALCLWLMCGFDQVGGFSHGKSYATDVAEIIARSQASMLPAQQRGLPRPPADVRRAVAPVDAVPSGTWAHDDEQFAGVDAHADHHRQYSPLPSIQHNENSLNHAISPTYLQGNVSSRSHSRLHVGGSERDVDASAEQRPQKKAWELEVERLRLTMQQQHLAGYFFLVLASSSFTISQQDQILHPRLLQTNAMALHVRLLRLSLQSNHNLRLPPQTNRRRGLASSLRRPSLRLGRGVSIKHRMPARS